MFSMRLLIAHLSVFGLCGSLVAQSAPCVSFTVVTKDKLGNITQGAPAKDAKWFVGLTNKYPGICYVEPSRAFDLVFFITVTPDVYHGARVVANTSTHSDPVTGTVTESDGSTSQVNGTVETTSTSYAAVPYSFEYGIFTLTIERHLGEGKFQVVHRFEQKGIYHTLYGIPLGGRGHHPAHATIEDAAKWISGGGLTDSTQTSDSALNSVAR
jgi:hypothetical protein